MRGRFANTVRLRVAAETQPPHPSADGTADTFPQGGRHFFPKTPTILTKRLQPAPPAHTVAIQLVQGDFVCWNVQVSLFLLGGGAYAALELAWRGTTHWTMFLTGGVLSLPFAGAGGSSAAAGPGGGCRGGGRQRAGAGRRRSLPPACCTPPSGITPTSGQPGRAGPPQIHRLLVFAVRVGHFCAARC